MTAVVCAVAVGLATGLVVSFLTSTTFLLNVVGSSITIPSAGKLGQGLPSIATLKVWFPPREINKVLLLLLLSLLKYIKNYYHYLVLL